MVARKKKKYSTGEGAQFVSRGAALHKLQLTLANFRRLCILKGIYPREPRNRKRAQKGSTAVKTLYHKKDIQFLMQEPIINKLRDYKIFYRKVGRAKAVKDFQKMRRYLGKHPTLKLDQIVKERYPTFVDALRDLDDCLTLCFLFSTFPSLGHIPREQFDTCRRLTMEFLHFVIEAKALRKVFVSIKGYYFQAEVLGETITWIVPHHFSYQPQEKGEVDFKIMSTFVEFYVIMLGFVNFRLYHSLNIYYPPKLTGFGINDIDKQLIDEEAYVSERISALNVPLSRISEDTQEEVEVDEFPNDGSTEELEEAKQEALKVSRLKTLFKGLKVFLNREVPREPLVFMLRCFGAEVSWEKDLFVGSTFEESDETITHQIVDRPILNKQYISRYYVQPQWIFDSINAREILPVKKYFVGETLPPHLSPFVDKNRDAEEQYIPPEEKALNDLAAAEKASEEDEEDSVEEEVASEASEEEETEEEDDEEAETETQPTKPKLSVKSGKMEVEQPWVKAKQEKMDYNLRAKMVKNRHRKLYKDMMESRKIKAKETWLLKKKRRLHDESLKEQKAAKVKGKVV